MEREALRQGAAALFALLAERLRASVGHDLLTVLAVGEDRTHFVRPYTNRPDQFPLGAADKVADSPWLRRLFGEKAPIVANDIPAILHWIPEFTDAATMGYGALVNVPIVVAGDVVGLINLMGPAGHFDARRVAAIDEQTPLAALALLVGRSPLPTLVVGA
jgi:hypothetical protein